MHPHFPITVIWYLLVVAMLGLAGLPFSILAPAIAVLGLFLGFEIYNQHKYFRTQ